MGRLILPRNLVAAAEAEGRQGWLVTALPAALGQVRPDVVAHGRRAVSARRPNRLGRTGLRRLGRRAGAQDRLAAYQDAAHEADGLRAWAGNGTVRLWAAHDFGDATALLIERCLPGTPLSGRPEPEQDLVVAALLRRLWIEPGREHPFRSLQLMCRQWADSFEQRAAAGQLRLDPGLARAGIALFRELPATATSQVLLCTDLHAGNMLAAAREPWLAIDPKPHVGDPAYDPLQHMLNCDERLRSDPHGLARRMAGLLGLDPGRVLLWLFARCVQESPEWPSLAAVAKSVAP